MHIPVLKNEVLKYLEPAENKNFVDCTIGNGGHAREILNLTGPKGKLLGIDWDPENIKKTAAELKEFKDRLVLVHDNYANLKEIVELEREKFKPIHGILLDLGVSSEHFEKSERGFSFRFNEPLDMRFNPEHSLNAQKILNFWSKFDIEQILKEYGEEQFAESIAKKIVEERSKTPIIKTFQLVAIVKLATPAWYSKRKLHPATKTFQALRIAVNSELENLQKVLPQAVSILEPGGRFIIISFHSLEDRIVKNFFKKEPRMTACAKKVIIPAFAERKENPKSRSAKLRAYQKI